LVLYINIAVWEFASRTGCLEKRTMLARN